MSLWYATFDRMYSCLPVRIKDAILRQIAQVNYGQSGQIEELKAELAKTQEILAVTVSHLSPVQQAQIAEEIGLKPASNSE